MVYGTAFSRKGDVADCLMSENMTEVKNAGFLLINKDGLQYKGDTLRFSRLEAKMLDTGRMVVYMYDPAPTPSRIQKALITWVPTAPVVNVIALVVLPDGSCVSTWGVR